VWNVLFSIFIFKFLYTFYSKPGVPNLWYAKVFQVVRD